MMLRWYLYSLVYVPFLLLAMIVAPVLPMFAENSLWRCDNGNGYAVEPALPMWLDWFMTQDNSLLGDSNWKATHDGGYLSQVLWLWRNPAYGLAWGPLSYTPVGRVTYKTTALPNGHRIDGSDGSYEYTRFKYGLKIRTGWILGSVIPALFLLSIRIKKSI